MASWSDQPSQAGSCLSVGGVLKWGRLFKDNVVLSKLEVQCLLRHRDQLMALTELGAADVKDLAQYIKIYWVWGEHNQDVEHGLKAAQFMGRAVMESLGVRTRNQQRGTVALNNFVLEIFGVIAEEHSQWEQQQRSEAATRQQQQQEGWFAPTQRDPNLAGIDEIWTEFGRRNLDHRHAWPKDASTRFHKSEAGRSWFRPTEQSPDFPEIDDWSDFACRQGIDSSEKTPQYVFGRGKQPPVASLQDIRRTQGGFNTI